MIGVAGVLGVLIAIASSQELSNSDSGASTTSFWIRILLGCLLFLGAYRQLQQRPAATISAAALSTGEDVSTVVVYALIGTAGVAAPLVVAVALGTRSTVILDGWKIWLAENNAAVMAVLFAVIGAVLVGKGISGLTA